MASAFAWHNVIANSDIESDPLDTLSSNPIGWCNERLPPPILVDRSRARHWLACAALLLVALAIGSSCTSESPPQDEHITSVAQAYVPGQNNPACMAAACPAGQVRTCGDVCVTPVAVGGVCSQTDCLSNSVCDPHFGASCEPTSVMGVFKCAAAPTGKGILAACTPSSSLDCPADTFCKDLTQCAGGSALNGFCAVGVEEGYVCDSNWTDAYDPSHVNKKCSPCMPGTVCMPAGSDGLRYCHKPCSTPATCPCNDNGETNACSGGKCYVCRSFGGECDDEHVCCDEANNKCGAFSGTCCKKPGQTCSAQSDCCGPTEVCLAGVTRICGTCRNLLDSCGADDDCCMGKCSGGQCVADCASDDGVTDCDTGLLGECKKGKISCTKTGPICKQTVFATATETCNGKDENCDGKIDNIAQSACPNAHTFTSGDTCQVDFVSSGHKECKDGVQVCVGTANVDYCAHCGVTLANGTDCGVCAATTCTMGGPPCTANHSCQSGSCAPISMCSPPAGEYCWHPSQNGVCCGPACAP